MSGVLAALHSLYGPMARSGRAPPPGFTRERIAFAVRLNDRGEPQLMDLRQEPRLSPRPMTVPAAVRRSTNLEANLFWDKAAYALGLAADGRLASAEHSTFVKKNLKACADEEGAIFEAFRRFLRTWRPLRGQERGWSELVGDSNVVFASAGEGGYLHDHPAVLRLAAAAPRLEERASPCLVTGRRLPVARLHPVIKRVKGAPSTGSVLASFALSAASRGHRQGQNAPVSSDAALRYGAALNTMLEPGSPERLGEVADMTLLGWRSTSPARLHFLALAPHAGRLHVRLWVEQPVAKAHEALIAYARDMTLEPAPWSALPTPRALIAAMQTLDGRDDPTPPALAAAVLAACASGERLPQLWAAHLLRRLRRGGDPRSGWTVAAVRAVLARAHRLDGGAAADAPPKRRACNQGRSDYRLGRLFALLEIDERRTLGRSGLRKTAFAAAAARPALLFPQLLDRQGRRETRRGSAASSLLLHEVQALWAAVAPAMPLVQDDTAQAWFLLGYHHERTHHTGPPRMRNEPFDRVRRLRL